MKGAGGIAYTTLVDTDGNWLFEPVKGNYVRYCSALDIYVIKDDNGKYLLDNYGNKYLYPSEDVCFWIKEDQSIEYVYLQNGLLYTQKYN